MATTLTAILTDGVRFGLAHVGDSRAYLLRDGGLVRLTTDHTLVQAMLDTGRITAEEAAASHMSHVVLQAIDAESHPTPDLIWLDLRAGDRLLLCSDGLSDLVARLRHPPAAVGRVAVDRRDRTRAGSARRRRSRQRDLRGRRCGRC